MRRIVIGGNSGGSGLLGRLLLPIFILLGIAALLLFLFAAFAFAVVLIPVGLALYAVKRVFFPKKIVEPRAPETGEAENPHGIDIIEVTDFQTDDSEYLEERKK